MAATFRQLEVFTTVVRAGNFASAARQLGISQVSVSRHIAALESACGGALFDRRIGRPARLNAVGHRFLAEATEILSRSKRIGFGTNAKNCESVSVRVGADIILLETVLRPSIPSIAVDGIPVSIVLEEVTDMPDVRPLLDSSNLDLVYYTFPVRQVSSHKGILLTTHEASLYASPDLLSRWGGAPGDQPLPIVMPSIVNLRLAMEDTLKAHGIEEFEVICAISPQNFIELLQRGLGAGIISCKRVEPFVAAGLLVELSDLFKPRSIVGRYVVGTGSESAAVDAVERELSKIIVNTPMA